MIPVDLSKATTDRINLPLYDSGQIEVYVRRLDKIHPVISGNKWFKLKYHLEAFRKSNSRGILTYGGAWSNHVLATAYAGRLFEIPSAAVIRGERPAVYSETLKQAVNYGMELVFVSRKQFAEKTGINPVSEAGNHYDDYYVIPEGGGGEAGIRGAAEILDLPEMGSYTHIAAAVGTGTMMQGLINAATAQQELMGFTVLKGLEDLKETFHPGRPKFNLFTQYHFGGYAKHNPSLLKFMNEFYRQTGIPTDFVYTAKLFFAIHELISKNYFPVSSKILIVHSGGLQGNNSLMKGTLIF